MTGAIAAVMEAVRRDRYDRELAEEMEFHREMLELEKARQGLAREAAAASARRQLGNTLVVREDSRDVWIVPGSTRSSPTCATPGA